MALASRSWWLYWWRGSDRHLEGIVEWEPVEEDIREELPQTEDPVDHPVGQPLGVVLFVLTLDGLHTAEGSVFRTQLRAFTLQRVPRLEPSK